jgi:hypothetical protein
LLLLKEAVTAHILEELLVLAADVLIHFLTKLPAQTHER